MHEHERQFHIQCRAGDVGRYCFLPGDPGRCEKIAAYFDNPVKIQSNREYASGSLIIDIFSCRAEINVSCLHLGQYNGKFSRTVSSRIFNRVLQPQTGHSIHST